jgi:hypothetical protein
LDCGGYQAPRTSKANINLRGYRATCLRSRDRVGPKAFLKSRTPFTTSTLILSPTHSQDLPSRQSAYLIQSHPNPTDQNPATHYCKPQKQSYELRREKVFLQLGGRKHNACLRWRTPRHRLTSLTHRPNSKKSTARTALHHFRITDSIPIKVRPLLG